MKTLFKIRTWHIWGGLALLLPVLIVAFSAVYMAHRGLFGGEQLKVSAGWLPGYQLASAKNGGNEARASLTASDGQRYVGTLNGLYRWVGGELVAVPELADTQVRGLAEASWGRVAATRGGIWVQSSGTGEPWRRVVKGDAWTAAAQAGGRVEVAVRNTGLLSSSDGAHWAVDTEVAAAVASLPASRDESVSLSKLMFDLHTGRAFFGREGEWIWIDLIGGILALLALTGTYTWGRNKLRKARQRVRY